jgi:hypothetical protein
MEQIKPAKVGSTRQIQNPHKAFEITEGVYEDRTEQMAPEQRLPLLTKAPDPQPFGTRR